MAGQDNQLHKTESGYFDLKVDKDKRDFASVDGLETAISVAIFTDSRAQEYQVSEPINRRGFIGDIIDRFELGCLLWTFAQARITRPILNDIQAYLQKRMDQFVVDGVCNNVEVEVARDDKSNPQEAIKFIIKMYKNKDTVEQYSLLWSNTKYAKLAELSDSPR